MSAIVNKLSEEDIKTRYITPALNARGWNPEHMLMEYFYTDGRVMVQGSFKHRRKGKKIDYLLFAEENYPIAIVEAKGPTHGIADGIQQAIDYAIDNDIIFAYSSNGEGFVEHDLLTGRERTLAMDEFPTREELKQRIQDHKRLTPEAQAVVEQPYYTDSDSYPPRYYQRIAINRTIEAIARGKQRILLVMATGTGKTYTAFQIIHRLHKSKTKKRILFIADRNNLIDQTMRQDFKPFSKFMTKIKGKKPEEGYELYMSLYGQWVKYDLKEDEQQPYEAYSPDFFDLIVVDECHRSSIKEDKEWHQILEYFSSATQIGLTATPKAVDGANNLEYFGEPVYTYSLRQGIDDGFLAPYRVTKCFLDLDLNGYEPEADELDIFNYKLEDPIFTRADFGRKISIRNRQVIVAHRITEMMKKVGRMTRTIVFCPDQEEAGIMRELLVQMNQDMVKKNANYVVRITSDDRVGKKLLDDFIDPRNPYPVIATTSEMLSTGVDCKTCGLIVIDKEVSSITTFKQMIGRGTRIYDRDDIHKLNFEILDFRNATANFNDPDFDGPADTHKTYSERKKEKEDDPITPQPEPDKPTKYHIDGKAVEIVYENVQFLGADGKTLCTESLTDFTRKTIQKKYPTLDAFRGAWMRADKKQAVIDELKEEEVLLEAIKEENPALEGCDPFDIICHIAFDQKPLTRKERIEGVQKRNYLAKYEGKARKVVEGLMEKYVENGITNIENKDVLQLNPFAQIATRPRIINGVFNGRADYEKAVHDLTVELYQQEA